MTVEPPAPTADSAPAPTVNTMAARMIDTWFPCREVDRAVKTPAGSGRSEKALFTWFASRPIAQARAAVLCAVLPDSPDNRADVRAAVEYGDESALERLATRISAQYGSRSPVVLDIFSGRGIIPLEAARLGMTAIGTDLSPVATLAGRLLAEYPLIDWSGEPELPFESGRLTADDGSEDEADVLFATESEEPRLLRDVRAVLAEVGRRVSAEIRSLYGKGPGAVDPWAYLWAVTIPCDGCRRRFPLIGSMVLRHPYSRTEDRGQAMRLSTLGDRWRIEVIVGTAQHQPTFTSGDGKRGKSARCPFPNCGTVHSLDVVKAKGFAGQYADSLLVVAEPESGTTRKVFRVPTPSELSATEGISFGSAGSLEAPCQVPTEKIPAGNTNTIQALLCGYATFGSLMNQRQAQMFVATSRVIAAMHAELSAAVSPRYAEALAAYAAANIPRQLRYATRGANLRLHGDERGASQNRVQVGDVFSSQSVIKHQFDYLEVGPGVGPGTWASVSTSSLNALKTVLAGSSGRAKPGRFHRATATSLPYRDSSVDALVCDPPYYDMITYADSSDLAYVWLKRALRTAVPDLFDGRYDDAQGLQDKSTEIIVKSKGRRLDDEHRTTDFYEAMLAKSFAEARRVLKDDGHLTVVFGHADPDAWKRLLAALTAAGFVVTSSWPSRTETAVTGVATISVTVSIGARIAPAGRPTGIAAVVDAEVVGHVKARCKDWDLDGLALEDQLMASYGAALTIVGRYSRVIKPSGAEVPLEHYMALARRAVRDAVALRLDDLPLDTFDPMSRLAVFWHELYGRNDVPKGEARFFAQSDDLRLDDLRGPILVESKKGFSLRHDAPERLAAASSTYEVVRAMADAWPRGSDAVGAVLAAAERTPTDAHVWAIVTWLATKLPASDTVAKQLAAVQRNRGTIQAATAAAAAVRKTESEPALTLFNLGEQ